MLPSPTLLCFLILFFSILHSSFSYSGAVLLSCLLLSRSPTFLGATLSPIRALLRTDSPNRTLLLLLSYSYSLTTYWLLARILLLLLFYSFGLIRILSAPSLLFLLEYSPSVYSDFPATIPFLFSYSYSSFPFLQGVGIEVGQ